MEPTQKIEYRSDSLETRHCKRAAGFHECSVYRLKHKYRRVAIETKIAKTRENWFKFRSKFKIFMKF